jgi:cysteine synthase
MRLAQALEQVMKDPVFQALDPRNRRFMEARWLPLEMNPFTAYNIEVAALLLIGLPHIKTVAAFGMMMEDCRNGRYKDVHTIVVDSSGNTAHAVARLARAFGFHEVKVVLSADVPESKKGILAALSSVEIIEVGAGKSVAHRAIEEARKPFHYHLNQYGHMGNVRAHEQFTGPEIVHALGYDISKIAVIAAAMGSGGTAAGIGRFFQDRNPKTIVVGVRPRPGEQVPGARNKKKMEEVVTLPWKESVDCVEEISRNESFERMRRLWSVVEPQPGPTSGLAWGGLEQLLLTYPPQKLALLDGKCVAFVCPDDGRFYSERTTGELDTDQGL